MKKLFAIFISMFLCLASLAQTSDNVLKFLGNPIDGSPAQMASFLKNKGFVYDIKYDCFDGKFNGMQSKVFICDNNGVVDRIFVIYGPDMTESNAKNHFNNLISQFRKNDKYIELVSNKFIPGDEDISYEMTVNNKSYEATFSLKPNLSDEDLEAMRTKAAGCETEEEQYAVILNELSKMITGEVWFKILENNGDYNIGIYYDNLLNRPNGEDL